LGELAHVKVDLQKLEGLDLTPLDTPEPELAYLFKHIVLHEVTYESLPFTTRTQLHEQLAHYLERQVASGTLPEIALLDTLVHHYTHSENHTKQRVYLEKAGQVAMELSAFQTAVDYYTRLLGLTPENASTRPALALKLADALYNLGDFPATRIAIEQAQASATNDSDSAVALTLLGNMTSTLGNYTEALTILTEAISRAKSSNDSATLCRALYALGSNYWRLGKLDEARVALEESQSIACTLGDLTRELFALNGLGGVALSLDETDKAGQIWQEVYTRASAAGNRERAMAALNNLGAVADAHHDALLEHQYTQQALSLAREIGAQKSIALHLINLGYADVKLGELLTARAELREGLSLALRLGVIPWVVSAVINFAELAYAAGQKERALNLYGLARQHPSWSGENQRQLDAALTQWVLEPTMVEVSLAKSTDLNWDKAVQELLNSS
jgi:tetratricopeptide (TPR) repeat protein